MLDPTSRMLRLLSLLQTYRYWSGSELAERLEVTERTLRRDIDRLRALGYPVHATRGVAGGYRLDAGGKLPPLLFDDAEAVALVVGLRISAGAAIDGIEETSVRALAKLEHVLPARLRHRVNALQSATVPLRYAGGPTVDPQTLTLLAGACRDHERVRFGYVAKDGTTTARHVEPYRLVSAGRRWYLVAFDVDRGDWRTFRVDRLERAWSTGARFPAREVPGGDAAEFVRAAIERPQRYEAVVTAHAPAGEIQQWVRGDGTVEPLDDRTCRVRFTGDSLEWMAVWLGAWGCDFEVHAPPELVDQVQQLHERFGRAAATYTGRGDLARSMALVWQPRSPLTERIVRGAIEIADADGLPAVGLRRIADRLGVDVGEVQDAVGGTAELIDAMVDTVLADEPPPSPSEQGRDWRTALDLVARATVARHLRHPWLLHVVTAHPPLGPHVMATWEAQLAIVDGLGLSEVEMDSVVSVVVGHAEAHARAMMLAEHATARTGSSDTEWWTAMEPLIENAFDPARYPVAARVGPVAGATYQAASSPQHAFEFGLQRILDGVQALVAANRAGHDGQGADS